MNFLLNAEQHEIQRSVERYLDAQLDTVELHRRFDAEAPEDSHSAALWAGLADLGIFSLPVPEADGGLGLEMIDLALVAEALGSRAAPVPFLGHVLAIMAIAQAGSAEQKAHWLPRLMGGETIATVALSGAASGWGPDSWPTAWSPALSGRWSLVPDAEVAQLIVVGLLGGDLGLVEAGAPGVRHSPLSSTDRTRRLGQLHLEQAAVQRLPGGQAFAAQLCHAALVLLAADAFGGATRCHQLATRYAQERVQFGQPIGQFQAVKHQIADMLVAVEPARGLYWYAAHAFDHGSAQESACMAALAKAHLAESFLSVARRCVELHGGMGYTWEMDVHIFLRRAMFDYAWLGQPAVHRSRLAQLQGW